MINTIDSSTNSQKKAVIYARVSTEEESTYHYSIEYQIKKAQEYCKLTGIIICKEYIDNGVSSKAINEKTALNQLLLDAVDEKFDEVIICDISRIAMDIFDLYKIINIFKIHNITFRSLLDKFDTETGTGKFGLEIVSAVCNLDAHLRTYS